MTVPFISPILIDSFLDSRGYANRSRVAYRSVLIKWYESIQKVESVEASSYVQLIYKLGNQFLERLDRFSQAHYLFNRRVINVYLNWLYTQEVASVSRIIKLDREWSPTSDEMFGYDLRKMKRRSQIFSEAEILKLLNATREPHPRDYIAILLMYNYGLRVCEISGLKLKHFQQIDGRWFMWIDGKVGRKRRSGRLIPMDEDIMREVFIYCKQYSLSRPDDPIYWRKFKGQEYFCRKHGAATPDRINKNLSAIAQEVIGRYFTSHNFRHSRITNLVASGADPYDIARQIGLTSLNTLKNHYDHSIPEALHLVKI